MEAAPPGLPLWPDHLPSHLRVRFYELPRMFRLLARLARPNREFADVMIQKRLDVLNGAFVSIFAKELRTMGYDAIYFKEHDPWTRKFLRLPPNPRILDPGSPDPCDSLSTEDMIDENGSDVEMSEAADAPPKSDEHIVETMVNVSRESVTIDL